MKIINSQAAAIDTCTLAYLYEYGDAKGQVAVQLAVAPDGSVTKATASTSLEGARNLRPCIEKAVKKYRFPEPSSEDKVTLRFSIQIQKGVKFKMHPAGEGPKDRAK